MVTEVTSWAELHAVRGDLNGSYVLTRDLLQTDPDYLDYNDPTGEGWEPIGHYDADWSEHPFTGTFDGQGYEIDGLFINRDQVDGIGYSSGLFGILGGTLNNLKLTNLNITNHNNNWGTTGGITGYLNHGSINNCFLEGNIIASPWDIGGLVGYNWAGTISKCYTNVFVNGNRYGGCFIGYHDRGIIENCYSMGSIARISGSTDTDFGGFVGYNYQGKIINCYSTGSVHYEGVADPTNKGFVGDVDTGGAYEMTGNFWDVDTSGQTTTSGNATGLNTSEMMDIATFSDTTQETLDESWDITDVESEYHKDENYIWNIVQNDTYPFFSYSFKWFEVYDTSFQTFVNKFLNVKKIKQTLRNIYEQIFNRYVIEELDPDYKIKEKMPKFVLEELDENII